jgi:hypothetical protein
VEKGQAMRAELFPPIDGENVLLMIGESLHKNLDLILYKSRLVFLVVLSN